MFKLYCRAAQVVFKIVAPALPWRRPEILKDNAGLVQKIQDEGIKRVMLVTDKVISGLNLPAGILAALAEANIACTVYDGTQPNPTIANIEEAFALYKKDGCEGIIAFGGGSPMDCAKVVGAKAVRPKMKVTAMRGLFKIHKKLPFLAAVPTTAGTGSETTLAAVVVDGETHKKYAINDHSLIPRYALLDPTLTVGLPKHVTAMTGLDALVHAVEAYIGRSNTKQTRADATRATELIFKYLKRAYDNGADLEAREKMQEAAFLAGAAFTRAYVGNIHAISHTISGMYGTAHGLTNAILMPHILEYYGRTIDKPMAELAFAAGIGKTELSQTQNAEAMLAAIKQLNADLNIPTKIPELKEEDIPLLAERAMKEANPLYPVPVIFRSKEMEEAYRLILVTAEEEWTPCAG